MNRPDIIINCAGLTNIEECENDIFKAYKVNALGARNLSIIARKLEAKLVHISTDDVLMGKVINLIMSLIKQDHKQLMVNLN